MKKEEAALNILYETLSNKGINAFVISLDFQRFLLDHELHEQWEAVYKLKESKYQSIHPDFHRVENITIGAFKVFFTARFCFTKEPERFYTVLNDLLERFVKKSTQQLNYDDLFDDLTRINFPTEKQQRLKSIVLDKDVSLTEPKKSQDKSSKVQEGIPIIQKFFSFAKERPKHDIFNSVVSIISPQISNPNFNIIIHTEDEQFAINNIDAGLDILKNSKKINLLQITISNTNTSAQIIFQFANNITGPNGNYSLMLGKIEKNKEVEQQLRRNLNLSDINPQKIGRTEKTDSEIREYFLQRKREWIRKLSKAEELRVVSEILDESILYEQSKLRDEIVNLSSRLTRLHNMMHVGVLKIDEINLEANRINVAILSILDRIPDLVE